jgi:hypothetical protein
MRTMFRSIFLIAALHFLSSCGGSNSQRSYIISESSEEEAVTEPAKQF